MNCEILIKGGKIVTPEKVFTGDLLVKDGLIADFGEKLAYKSINTIDASGLYVLPGLVDVHTHGGYGGDFMDRDEGAFKKALSFHTENGTTTLVATSCTAPKKDIIAFLEYCKSYMEKPFPSLARVAGVHLEGPYLSEKNRGAQKKEDLATPTKDDYSYMFGYADIIKTVTISPELEGAAEMTKALVRKGIKVCGGHDDGIYPEFMPAIENGLSHLTHIYCAMSELRFKEGKRNVGLREYGLVDPRLTVEMIADNRHIPPLLAVMILNAKGADKTCVVSDSLRIAGLPADGKVYTLGSGENAMRIKAGDGVALLEDGSKFAGSITPVVKMVKNLIDAGVPITDAVKTASLTPAKIIGEDEKIGSIEKGKRADIVLADNDFNAVKTLIGGLVAFDRNI